MLINVLQEMFCVGVDIRTIAELYTMNVHSFYVFDKVELFLRSVVYKSRIT